MRVRSAWGLIGARLAQCAMLVGVCVLVGAADARGESAVPEWIERMLESLEPSKPRAYFEAAESMMRGVPEGSASVAAVRRLTQETLVIGLELWRKGPSRVDDARLGPSILLAIASIEADPTSERARWLRVLAAAVDSQGLVSASDERTETAEGAVDDSAVLDVLSALELLRGGEGRRTQRLLERPEVFAVLKAHERLLHPAGLTGEADRIRRLAAEWPVCVQCRNRRSVRDSGGIHLCPTCRGDPGPPFTDMEVLYQLRLEAILLSGAQQSWVSQTLVDGGRPLRDLDAGEVAPTLNVDETRVLRRRGAWVGLEGKGGSAPVAPAAPMEKREETGTVTGGAAPSGS